jgi:hypothetical protein
MIGIAYRDCINLCRVTGMLSKNSICQYDIGIASIPVESRECLVRIQYVNMT